jgi:hypothetical protein
MIGMIGPLRYILITDALLLSMQQSPDEVEAVFAHEVAHVKFHHTRLYMLLMVGAMSAGLLAGTGVSLSLPPDFSAGERVLGCALTADDIVPISMAAAVLAYLWLVFGYISRRCEVEADLYAVRATACPAGCSPPESGHAAPAALPPVEGEAAPAVDVAWAPCPHRVLAFTGALQRISRLNGSPETRRGWRHFSVARRCAILMTALVNPGATAGLERRIRRAKTAVVLLTLALIVASAAVTYWVGASESDHPQNPASPPYINPDKPTWLVRFVDRNEVDVLALGSPQFDGQAHAAAHLDDRGLAGLRWDVAATYDYVAVEDARGHAVAVDPQGHRTGADRGAGRQFDVFRDAVGGRRG